MLYKGSNGEEVKLLQQKLIAKGFSCGRSGADGIFGQATYDAVISFKRANGLQVDGIVRFHNGRLFNHSGIVERVEKNIIYTIEGNVSDSVRRGIHDISESKIHGYGMNGGIE